MGGTAGRFDEQKVAGEVACIEVCLPRRLHNSIGRYHTSVRLVLCVAQFPSFAHYGLVIQACSMMTTVTATATVLSRDRNLGLTPSHHQAFPKK